MAPLTGENAIRLFCLNVLLFCALIFAVDYAERRGVITVFGFKGPKLSDSDLRKMVWDFRKPEKREKETNKVTDWNKQVSEKTLLNPLIKSVTPYPFLTEVTYEMEEEICGDDVFAFTNQSFLATTDAALLRKGSFFFVHNAVDKIGDNEFMIRAYDSKSRDKVGNFLKSGIIDQSVFFGDVIAENSTFRRQSDPFFIFGVAQTPSEIKPGAIVKVNFYDPPQNSLYSLCFKDGAAFNGSNEQKWQDRTFEIKEDWFSFNDTLLISLQRGRSCHQGGVIFTPRIHGDFVFLQEIAQLYNQWSLSIFLPYRLKFQQLYDFEKNLIDINPHNYMTDDGNGRLIFDDAKTLMIDVFNQREFSIAIKKQRHAPPFCHKDKTRSATEEQMTLEEAASKSEYKTYFMEELACGKTPRLFINSSSSVDEIVEYLGYFIGTREVVLGNAFVTAGPDPVLSSNDNFKNAKFKTRVLQMARRYAMDVDPFKIINFEDIKTGKPLFSHHFAEEKEVFLACPNHRSGRHCIRSISAEEMKEEPNIYYVCRDEVLIDRNVEAYEKRTLVKLTETDLNNATKALESGLYSFKTVNEDCSPGSRPYHILSHEDLQIHAELREKYNHYKDAKFLMNMRQAPSGYFYAYEESRANVEKLIKIDFSLFINCKTNLFAPRDVLTLSVKRSPGRDPEIFFRRRAKTDDRKYFSRCYKRQN